MEYEAKTIRNEGITIGRNEGISIGHNQGIAEGRVGLCMELIKSGKMTVKEASAILGMKADAVEAQYNERYGKMQSHDRP